MIKVATAKDGSLWTTSVTAREQVSATESSISYRYSRSKAMKKSANTAPISKRKNAAKSKSRNAATCANKLMSVNVRQPKIQGRKEASQITLKTPERHPSQPHSRGRIEKAKRERKETIANAVKQSQIFLSNSLAVISIFENANSFLPKSLNDAPI